MNGGPPRRNAGYECQEIYLKGFERVEICRSYGKKIHILKVGFSIRRVKDLRRHNIILQAVDSQDILILWKFGPQETHVELAEYEALHTPRSEPNYPQPTTDDRKPDNLTTCGRRPIPQAPVLS